MKRTAWGRLRKLAAERGWAEEDLGGGRWRWRRLDGCAVYLDHMVTIRFDSAGRVWDGRLDHIRTGEQVWSSATGTVGDVPHNLAVIARTSSRKAARVRAWLVDA